MQTERIQEGIKLQNNIGMIFQCAALQTFCWKSAVKTLLTLFYFCLFGVRGNKKSLICYILKMFKKDKKQPQNSVTHVTDLQLVAGSPEAKLVLKRM